MPSDASRLAGLDPAQNVRLLGEEVDLDLEEFGLVLEVDGGVHDNPLAQLDDARKQARLERKGVHVTRVGRR